MQKLLASVAILLLVQTIQAQEISGSWQGLIPVGTNNIRFIMIIKKTASGYESTFDSPDQKAFGIQGSKTNLVADSILTEIQIMKAGYRGKWDGKDSITGTYQQSNRFTPLNMKRLNERDIPKPPPTVVRPQTPKEPFGYFAEEVIYKNADQSIQYSATLTKPSQGEHFPTVILISGSGTQDRDGTMFGHKTYAVLADLLTKQGIAVLRVDDRGAGKSTLGPNPLHLTSVDFGIDVANSINYLISRPDIDKNKIGLVGHSEGGMIAPMVAVNNKSVAFLVLLAGPGQTGLDIWNFQMRRSFIKYNLNVSDQLIAAELVNNMNLPFTKYTELNAVQIEMKSTYADWKKQYADSIEKKLFITPIEPVFLAMANQYKSGLYWLNYFLNYQPEKNLQQLKIPVLALNGENDIQVSCVENLSAIEKALKKGKNKHYKIQALPQLNHLFQTASSKVQNYDTIDESFSPDAAKLIGNWILHDATKK